MKEIHDFSRSLWNTIQERNVEEFKKLTHANALFIHMGVTLSRDEEANTIAEGRIIYQSIDFQEERIEEMDSVTIVLNKMTLTAIVGGNEVTNPFVVTEVYTKLDESYKLASLSFTKINY